MKQLTLTYQHLKTPVVPLIITPLVVVMYLGITYLHPENNQWLTDGSFDWGNLIRFILIDQIAIEWITYFIIAWCIVLYAATIKLNSTDFSLRGIFVYQAKFLPLFLVVFFCFNPVTQTVRYWYHEFPQWNAEEYFESYFYSVKLYLTYLLPVFLGGYALLNVNLYLNYRDNLFHERADNVKKNKIEASDPDGKTVVNLDDVISFERIGRNNVVNIPGQQLRIKYSLNELEQILNGDKFLRINRSTIINLSSFKNYSFWENDKYILRLQNGKEYTVSRERMKNLKNKLL